MEQQFLFEKSAPKIVNVASVPMRSPFRYAGGKTWLVPRIRQWLAVHGGRDKILVEPFAGGGIVSLTSAFEQLVRSVVMVEIDEQVAAVWRVIIEGDAKHLAQCIETFKLTPENAKNIIRNENLSDTDRAFATIVKNRVNRGGILADGASFIKSGENGKGISSRWYPATLKRRIMDIYRIKGRITFIEGDGFDFCETCTGRTDAVFFIDPPYTKAGRRLYRYPDVDHPALFDLAARLTGNFLMTYDDVPEIRNLAEKHGFDTRTISMKNTHHARKKELLISRDLSWLLI